MGWMMVGSLGVTVWTVGIRANQVKLGLCLCFDVGVRTALNIHGQAERQ